MLFLPPKARFDYLLKLPEGENFAQAINEAMRLIEDENEELRGVLPRSYNRLDNATLAELLKVMSSIPMDIEGDAFGKIYEYFLGTFAMREGQKRVGRAPDNLRPSATLGNCSARHWPFYHLCATFVSAT